MTNSHSFLNLQVLLISVVVLFCIVHCAPSRNNSSNAIDENCDQNASEESVETIDQRQNGTENVRVNVKDVVLVWAPSDALLGSSAILDSDLLDYPNEEVPQKPIGSNEVVKPTSIFDILASFPNPAATVQNSTTSKPQRPIGESSTSTTENNSEANSPEVIQNLVSVNSISANSNMTESTPSTRNEKTKRSKLRLSGLIMPFIRRKMNN